MPIDLTQFHEGFFEEAAEHIERMESLLLEIDLASPDSEKLNAIFRAAHSIKGGSGTFGLTAMKEFTHVLESLLDRVRHGEIELSVPLIDVFLEAGDVLREQLARYRDGKSDDPVRAHEVGARLKALTNTAPTQETARAKQPLETSNYDIEFTSSLQEGQRGAAYDGLLSALRASGTLTVDSTQDASTSPWKFALAAAISPEAIYDIFDYINVPGDTLRVERSDSRDEPMPEDEAGFGFFDDAPGAPAKMPQVAEQLPDWNGDERRRKAAELGSSSVRVTLQKLDQLINLVGEMVIAQSKVAQIVDELDPTTYQHLHQAIELMQRNVRDLQDSVMSTRMLPIGSVFSRFPRTVRELAATLYKEVVLSTIGDDTELDKGLLEQIVDPLTHLVRNSLDHGIESPEDRVAVGKPREGHLTLRSSNQGGNVVVEVIDDGRGLDREKIIAKARESNVFVDDAMPDREVWQLIFAPGFSTSRAVTDVSGRGVGMDIVKRNVDGLGGRIEIDSVAGRGMSVTIRLPLTLTILDGLSVGVGREIYIIPLAYIIESIQANFDEIKTIAGRGEVIHFRGEYLPILWLKSIFHIDGASMTADQGILVVLEAAGRKAALVVDSLENQHQVVVKSLSANYRRVRGVSGATILGNGRVSLILDVPGLLSTVPEASRVTELALNEVR